MGNFLVQIGIFLILLVGFTGILKMVKVTGKDKMYVFVALLVAGSLLFVAVITRDFQDRTFWFIMLFGLVALSSVIAKVVKNNL